MFQATKLALGRSPGGVVWHRDCVLQVLIATAQRRLGKLLFR